MSTTTPTPTGAPATGLRTLVRILAGQATSDGAGVHLTRLIGSRELPDLDPFLLLDEFGSDDPGAYIAGFPSHPHRGFETITYMLAGRMRHRDNQGNEGLLTAGAVQWMTAGRGIVHSEMPEQEEGLMRGFQLWLNLPAAEKMRPAEYRDVAPGQVPAVDLPGGGRVVILAGDFAGTGGVAPARATSPLYLDVQLPAGGTFETPVDPGHTALAYAYEGAVTLGDDPGPVLPAGRLGILGDGDRIRLGAGATPARALVIAGRPLREPVARYGPFVMNTQAEIVQAVTDFQAGRFGPGS